jgi:methyl acetate hydrolase
MRQAITFLLTVAILSRPSVVRAQSLTEQGVGEIDMVLQRAVDERMVPGVVAIVANKDRVLYYHAAGLRDVQNQKPMQTDSIFRIASMTKPVTSSAIMMLLEQGKLGLDDPISKYLPAFANREVIASFNSGNGSFTTRKAAGPILIRHLLTHTSGLAYDFSNPTVNQLQQITRKQLYELPLLYDPGTRWTYSNSTTVLGQLIEKISGVRLDAFLADHLFSPLSMQETFYAVPNNKRDRVVTIHRREQGVLTEVPNPDRITSAVVGEGGLFSVASDYIKFLQMFLNNGTWQGQTILSRSSIEEMTKNQIGSVVVETQPDAIPSRTRPFPIGAGRDKFGFGFQITMPGEVNLNLRSSGSYSWAGINNTHFWVDPKRGIAAVILMQVLPFYDETCMKIYRDFEETIGRNLRQ